MNEIVIKIVTILISLFIGIIFYVMGINQGGNIKILFVSMSGTFFVVPILYLLYELMRNVQQQRLNQTVFEYLKTKIDRGLSLLVVQLAKIVYDVEEKEGTSITQFIKLDADAIKERIAAKELLGFQIFKKWSTNETTLNEILANIHFTQYFRNEQIIALIWMIQSLNHLESLSKIKDLYVATGQKTTEYEVASGEDMGDENQEYQNRYLLLKTLEGNGQFQVVDFGDFDPKQVSQLTSFYKINEKYLTFYATAISVLLQGINHWLTHTGGQFMADTKIYQLLKISIEDTPH